MGASGTGKRKSKFEPQMAGFVKAFLPLHYRDRFASWDEANRFAAAALEDCIIAEDPETVAAVILEPISNTAGLATPTDEFLQMVAAACRRHNVMLIYDEVITGFGRTGAMFAAQAFNACPDIICAGKGLSSGAIPLGSMIAREDMGDAFLGPAAAEVQFAHGNTFAGNPLAAAVGMAVIDEIVEKIYAAMPGGWASTSPRGCGNWSVSGWSARSAAAACCGGSSWRRTRPASGPFRRIASWASR